MIQLRSDQIFLGTPGGGAVPCSVEQITLELVGSAVGHVGSDMLREATAAVLHYFKEELGRLHITPEEFARALAKVLNGLGVSVEITEVLSEPDDREGHVAEDLRDVAVAAGKLGELAFFPRLQEVLWRRMEGGVATLEFCGLRPAVKQLLGCKHWNRSCRELEERIVESLRGWWAVRSVEVPAPAKKGRGRALVVR